MGHATTMRRTYSAPKSVETTDEEDGPYPAALGDPQRLGCYRPRRSGGPVA